MEKLSRCSYRVKNVISHRCFMCILEFNVSLPIYEGIRGYECVHNYEIYFNVLL